MQKPDSDAIPGTRQLPSAVPMVAIVGTTATGKSDLALSVAECLMSQSQTVEILNSDAMQVYRGMDIGTAKVTAEERERVPHHLLDYLDVHEEAALADYQLRALNAAQQVHGRGAIPVLAGGSALYVNAVVDGFEIPPTDAQVRARLEGELLRIGGDAMHQRLAEIDPAAAAAILPGNTRRVIRALEVNELTSRPFVAQLPQQPDVPHLIIGVRRDRADLDERIERRVHQMFAAGLLEETQGLRDLGLESGKTAARALGYQQALDVLHGRCTVDEAIESTIVGTRKFARRQISWFKRDRRIQWLDVQADAQVHSVLPQAMEWIEQWLAQPH